MALGLEEWLVPRARLGIQRGQGLAPRLQQQRLKQQRSLVLEEPEFSLALASVVLAFLVRLAQFLASEALQGSGLQMLLLPPPPPLKQPNSVLLEASQELESLVSGSLVSGFQVSESQVLESQVLESLVLGSLVLGSLVLEFQGPCPQPQLLKQQPKQPNSGPEAEWELEAFPHLGLALGAFLASETQQQLRQLPPPRQPKSVLGE